MTEQHFHFSFEFGDVVAQVRQSEAILVAQLQQAKEQIMALSTEQQAAVDALTAEISDLGTSIDGVLSSATANAAEMRARIEALTTLTDQLAADDAADAATIESLRSEIAALNTAAEANQTEVISVLSEATGGLKAVNARVDAVAVAPTEEAPPAG